MLGCTPLNFLGDSTTSVTEAWRDSVYHVTLISSWNYNATLGEKESNYTTVSRAIQFLRDITPVAAYSVSSSNIHLRLSSYSHFIQNEADVHEPDHEGKLYRHV